MLRHCSVGGRSKTHSTQREDNKDHQNTAAFSSARYLCTSRPSLAAAAVGMWGMAGQVHKAEALIDGEAGD
jgi:hypothetical protein